MEQVPQQVKRAVNVAANFLCDNSGYILGADLKGNPKRTQDTFAAFQELHRKVLIGVDDLGARAVLSFLQGWNPAGAADHPLLEPVWKDLVSGGNIIFKLHDSTGFVHNRPAMKAVWERFHSAKESTETGQCLITGENGPIARLHANVKGVSGAQSTGAALVSFNLDAFTSYGKKQSLNAPVSEAAAFAYVTTLNYLLRSDRHHLRIGESTVVFWAETAGVEEDMIAELLNPGSTGVENIEESDEKRDASERHHDTRATRLVRDVLAHLAEGRLPLEGVPDVDPDVRFFILGLSPNSARLSVRFWHEDTFGSLVERIGRHYTDMAITLPAWESGPFSIYRIVKETAPLGDMKRAAPLLAGAFTRSVLLGAAYPQGLYTALLSRIRADHELTPPRAAVIKACLVRRARIQGYIEKERMMTVSLNEQSTDQAYLLGRLFALLEKAQQDATPGLNATIRDRYFGSASATPQAVFPVLLRLAQHHIAKAEYGGLMDKRIEGVLAGLKGFPAHLNLEEQGLFVLGYYHQRQAFYTKKAAGGPGPEREGEN